MPTLYSLGKAKIVGMASASGVAGVNRRRSAENTEAVTGNLAVKITRLMVGQMNCPSLSLTLEIFKAGIAMILLK